MNQQLQESKKHSPTSKKPRVISLVDLYQKPYGSIEEAAAESDKNYSYVAGSDGLFKVSKIGGPGKPAEYTIVTSIREAPGLRDIKTGFFVQRVEKIPMTLLARCAALFRMVYERHNSEMIMILRWNEERQEYFLDRAKFGTIGPGYLRYCFDGERTGTIHSHGGIHACFSFTDDEDDLNKPGIHIVMGEFGREKQSIVSSLTGAGERFKDRKTDIESWAWSFEITEEEYNWFTEHILLIDEIQKKSSGYYIIEKGSGKVAYWTETEDEAKALVNPFFEIEKIVKKDRTRFYAERKLKIEEPERWKKRPRKEKRFADQVSSQEAAIAGFIDFILENDLVYELADTFSAHASAETTRNFIEHLEGCLGFLFDDRENHPQMKNGTFLFTEDDINHFLPLNKDD
jgi:hypothetical protein